METTLTARKGELLLRCKAQGMLLSAEERIESPATGSVRGITPKPGAAIISFPRPLC